MSDVCSICKTSILDNESRVTCAAESPMTCHRRCAAAKYPTYFENRPLPLSAYSLCESVTASSISPWCIRPLTATGKHLGGGVDSASLCGRVRPLPDGLGGWDLRVDFDTYLGNLPRSGLGRGLGHLCRPCWLAWAKLTGIPLGD